MCPVCIFRWSPAVCFSVSMSKKVLFLSNGHGEDVNGSMVAQALHLQDPTVQIGAMPIVGAGNSYRKFNIPIIGPTKSEMPSGGFAYMDKRLLVADIFDGLIGRLWQQVAAVRQYCQDADLIFVTGDQVVLGIAALTKCPYLALLSSCSAHYEGRLRIAPIKDSLIASDRCKQIFTRDLFTTEVFRKRGFKRSNFWGNPFMDALIPSGRDLQLDSQYPLVALLPGSRLPEAANNLVILLRLAIELSRLRMQPQMWLALTPNFLVGDFNNPLQAVAKAEGWEYRENQLYYPPLKLEVGFATDAFADILEQCDLVCGMAGTAIEQAVGLGKPIVQLPGNGPQFIYSFAEAQMRLLGDSIETIGTQPADAQSIQTAAEVIDRTLADPVRLRYCSMHGQERVGGKGAAAKMAQEILRLI
jgi:uncharacterized protein (TIGR03492 family)